MRIVLVLTFIGGKKINRNNIKLWFIIKYKLIEIFSIATGKALMYTNCKQMFTIRIFIFFQAYTLFTNVYSLYIHILAYIKICIYESFPVRMELRISIMEN